MTVRAKEAGKVSAPLLEVTALQEEFRGGADSQQDAKEGHHSGLADGAGEEGREAVPEPQEAGREKESKHDAPLGFGIAYKKRRKQRSPALERPPGSHEHPDVVFRQYVTAIPIGP